MRKLIFKLFIFQIFLISSLAHAEGGKPFLVQNHFKTKEGCQKYYQALVSNNLTVYASGETWSGGAHGLPSRKCEQEGSDYILEHPALDFIADNMNLNCDANKNGDNSHITLVLNVSDSGQVIGQHACQHGAKQPSSIAETENEEQTSPSSSSLAESGPSTDVASSDGAASAEQKTAAVAQASEVALSTSSGDSTREPATEEVPVDMSEDEEESGVNVPGEKSDGKRIYKSPYVTASSQKECATITDKSEREKCIAYLKGGKDNDAMAKITISAGKDGDPKHAEDGVSELDKIRNMSTDSEDYEPGQVPTDQLTFNDLARDADHFSHRRGCDKKSGEAADECKAAAFNESLAANCQGVEASDIRDDDVYKSEDGKVETTAQAECAKYAKEDQALKQALTDGQVPNDFYELVNNQGLKAYYDPDLPKARYIDTNQGTVAWPETCSMIAPGDGKNFDPSKIVKAEAIGELQNQSIDYCSQAEQRGSGGFIYTGKFSDVQERQMCMHARATECPKLNYAFDFVCENAFVDPSNYAKEDFKNEPQKTFYKGFCKEKLESFYAYLAFNIKKDATSKSSVVTEGNQQLELDRYWSSTARKYGLIEAVGLQDSNSMTLENWLEIAKRAESQYKVENPETLEQPIDEAIAALNKGCTKDCKKNVMNKYSVAQLYGSGQNDAGKMGEFGKAVYNSLGRSAVEDGETDPLFTYVNYKMPEGLGACTREAYAYRRNVYIGHCTAIRAMARYGTDDNMPDAAGDVDFTSFDGQFTCVRNSVYTVDYNSCKALLNVYNAGKATEMIGGQATQAGDMIKSADVQEKVAKQQAEGDNTAALKGMRSMARHQRDTETVKATFYGVNTMALTGAMAAFVTPSKIEEKCESEMGGVGGFRCLQAAHPMVNDNPNLKQEFFPNQEVHDRFYGVVMETFGKGMVAGLMAYMHHRRAKIIDDAAKKYATPEFVDNRGFLGDDFCLRNPMSQMCGGGGRGRVSRDGVEFGGFASGNQGGGEINYRNNALGEYESDEALSPSEKAAREDLSDLMGSGGANKVGSDFNKVGAPTVKVGSAGGGGGNTKASGASAQGGSGGGGGGATAEGGSSGGRGGSESGITIGGKQGAFRTFSGKSNKKSDKNNPFDNMLGKKGSRNVATLDIEEKIHPKNIGLFDKISQRYAKVSGENRLHIEKSEGKK